MADSERKKPQRTGKPINMWFPEDLMSALERMMNKTRRTKTTEVIIALESHLAAHGFWPPPSPPSESGESGGTSEG